MAVPSGSSLPPPELNTPAAENWCYSRVKVEKFTYIWGINYFSLRREGVGQCIRSSKFSGTANNVVKWRLEAYPKGDNGISNEYLALYLVLASCNGRHVCSKCKLAILNNKREQTNIQEMLTTRVFTKEESYGYSQFIRRDFLLDEANGLLPGDTLTIFCEVTVVSDNENLSGQSNAVQLKVPECHLSEDLGSVLFNGRFSDITLSVRDKKFRAHKVILAERSPVFAAMFEHDMMERKTNIVNITDVDEDVFKEMLNFIYTGRVTSLDNIAQDLLPAADKYALERLKVMCEEALCKSLSVDKAVDFLILADRHSADQLKTQAINYINMYAADVMRTQAWKTMILSHPQLFAEVFSVALGEPPRKRVKRS